MPSSGSPARPIAPRCGQRLNSTAPFADDCSDLQASLSSLRCSSVRVMPGGGSTWPKRSRSSAMLGVTCEAPSVAWTCPRRARSAAMAELMSAGSVPSPKSRRASGRSEARMPTPSSQSSQSSCSPLLSISAQEETGTATGDMPRARYAATRASWVPTFSHGD
eukprot:scaffold3808_cov112-Isochrysis_galbana.AAC.40